MTLGYPTGGFCGMVLPPFVSLPPNYPRSGPQGSTRVLPNRSQQRLEIVTAVMTNAVDEEGGRSVDAAANAAEEIIAHPGGVTVFREILRERLELYPDGARVGEQVLRAEPILMLEDHVVHLPEAVPGSCCFGCVGGLERMRVDLAQGEVAIGEAEVVAERRLQRLHDGIRRAAERAFVVAVLHHGDARGLGADDMIPFADGHREPRRRHQHAHNDAPTACSCICSSAARMPSAPRLTPIGDT